MSEKIIRDPVHDVIAFRTERPAEGLLFRLLNAAEFQRLRRIRQLGMASLAYPGADHSRYSHSLGVMETARKMLDQLGRAFTLDDGPRDVCLVASLLHDLGHGPFSHVFERVAGIDHESHTRQIVDDPASEVHQLLAEHDRALPGEGDAKRRGHPEYLKFSLGSFRVLPPVFLPTGFTFPLRLGRPPPAANDELQIQALGRPLLATSSPRNDGFPLYHFHCQHFQLRLDSFFRIDSRPLRFFRLPTP